NQRPVPAILPPPKMWLIPCASITAPTVTRRTSSARLIESASVTLTCLVDRLGGMHKRAGQPRRERCAWQRPARVLRSAAVGSRSVGDRGRASGRRADVGDPDHGGAALVRRGEVHVGG